MNFNEAERKYTLEYDNDPPNGSEFPYSRLLQESLFTLVNIPIHDLNDLNDTYEGTTTFYVTEIEKGIHFDPIWITYGKVMKDGKLSTPLNKKCTVLDGKHKASAYKEKGLKQIAAYIPHQMYNAYTQRGSI